MIDKPVDIKIKRKIIYVQKIYVLWLRRAAEQNEYLSRRIRLIKVTSNYRKFSTSTIKYCKCVNHLMSSMFQAMASYGQQS